MGKRQDAKRMAESDADDDDGEDAPKVDLSMVIEKADRMLAIDAEAVEMVIRAKALSEERRIIATETLPNLMDAIGQSMFALLDGSKVEIKPLLAASIPSKSAIEKEKDPLKKLALVARQKKAFAALRTAKAGDLIRSTLEVDAGMGTTAKVQKVLKAVKAEGLVYRRNQSVAPASLKKWIKGRKEKGLKVDAEAFAVFDGREAKITKAKK